MTKTLEFHHQMKTTNTGDGIRGRLNKKLPADISQITNLLTHWINETELKWDCASDDKVQTASERMFYEDRIFRDDTMFRYRRIRNGASFRKELVLARVFVAQTEQGKGYFSQLLSRLEEIALEIEADLSIECASTQLSSILLQKGYLRQPHNDQRHMQLANALEGSWVWHRNDREFQHKLVTVPTALIEQIERMSSHCRRETDSVIQQELHNAFARISSRLDAEVKSVNNLRNEELYSHLRKLQPLRNQCKLD